MQKNVILAGLVAGMGFLGASQVSAFELDFGVVGNSQMQFNAMNNPSAGPATLKFNPSTVNGPGKGNDFQVNATVGGNNTGSAVGDYGILSGTFSITPVNTSAPGNIHYYISTSGGTGPGNITDGSVAHSSRIAYQDFTETAAVNGMGTLTIKDGLGHNLVGVATLSNISDQYRITYNNNGASTVKSTTFISDGLTGSGPVTSSGYTLNVTGITYTGTQKDLMSLASGDKGLDGKGQAQLDATWSFNNKKLTTMTQVGGGINKVSYSGHIESDAHTLPDGGMTLALLGVTLSGAAMLKRRLVS